MAVMLGKRKRRAEIQDPAPASTTPESSEESGAEDIQDAFRRAFEARFKPLEGRKPQSKPAQQLQISDEEADDSSEDSDSDWSGFSDSSTSGIEVVEHTQPTNHLRMSKAGLKSFMSSKPPTTPKPTSTTQKPTDSDDATEASHLKNDLALQRLLTESHLLSQSKSPASSTLDPTGRTRLKSTDLRLLSLGAKRSVYHQDKMPTAMRKGIAAKAAEREERRRREAKEAGVVLEREKRKEKEKKKGGERRERGVGGPGVGRFRGGVLMVSRRDVRSIEGGRGGRGGKKGGRR